jgi:hypothetical protein
MMPVVYVMVMALPAAILATLQQFSQYLLQINFVHPVIVFRSVLIKRLKGDGVTQMPKNKTPLEAQIITSIATWIQEGALDN